MLLPKNPKSANARVDLSGRAFSEVDRTGYAASFISYLDKARSQLGQVKSASYLLLGLQPNQRVLDVGCGTGDDVREMAALVAPHGIAVGVDNSELMIVEAQRRADGCGLPVQFRVSEAQQLPWESGYFDACRADRLLQHVPDPGRTFNELVRVVRPGGRLVVVDRDWGMVALDAAEETTTRAVLERASAGIRNGWIGRRLHGFFRAAGLNEIRVQAHCINITSFDIADALLDLRIVAEHAISAGDLPRQVVEAWLDDLLRRDRLGTFFAAVTLFVVVGVKP
jgi:ubiquinone/menaquinone biosynthesis C-methylase UbiE